MVVEKKRKKRTKHKQKSANVKLDLFNAIIIGMKQQLFMALLLYKYVHF